MAQHRHEHVKSRLGELDRMRMTHRLQQQQLGFDTQSSATALASNIGGAQRTLTFTDVTPP